MHFSLWYDADNVCVTCVYGRCCVDACSVVFWLGDLNYRIDDIDSEVCKQMITKGQLEQLLENDQVIAVFCLHHCLSSLL